MRGKHVAAVFIDAGYLWKQLCKALFPSDTKYHRSNVNLNYVNFQAVLAEYVKTTFFGIPLLRCYWYDAPLFNGNLSSDHNKIALLNDFKLRLGSRIIEAEGKTKQKGVDGLIIADLIGLAQNKVLSHALLISGDGDMVPGVGVAQALGVRIHLLAIHSDNATSPQLRMEADSFDVWQEEISRFAQGRNDSDTLRQEAAQAGNSPCATLPPLAPASAEEDKMSSPMSPASTVPARVIPPLTEFFESLTVDEKKSVSQAQVPYDIDRRLLRFVLERKGRALTEEEKRAARNNLREFVREFQQ